MTTIVDEKAKTTPMRSATWKPERPCGQPAEKHGRYIDDQQIHNSQLTTFLPVWETKAAK